MDSTTTTAAPASFTMSNLEAMAEKFCGKTGEGDAELVRRVLSSYLGFALKEHEKEQQQTQVGEGDSQGKPSGQGDMAGSATPPVLSTYSSIGRKRSSSARKSSKLSSAKIGPEMKSVANEVALDFLSSPEATLFVKNYNYDLEFENKKSVQMDSVRQQYIDEEDEKITASLGLIAGMNMAKALSFKNFKTTFSSTKYLRGFYNLTSGDIFMSSKFTVRADHSHVAARMTNYYLRCINPAYSALKEVPENDGNEYLEVRHTCTVLEPKDATRKTICI